MNFTRFQLHLLEVHFKLDNSPTWDKFVRVSKLIGCETLKVAKWWSEKEHRKDTEVEDHLGWAKDIFMRSKKEIVSRFSDNDSDIVAYQKLQIK